jgi:beta-lactamase regulating signal transducer with metallopeptidase domain
MNNLSEYILKTVNDIGRAFCNFSLTMLIQASVLIFLVFIIDIIIRKRVRATFRYWIWMLVFIKLILPPALSLPTGIGNWFGEYFVVSSTDSYKKPDNITQQENEAVQSTRIANSKFAPQQITQFQGNNRPFVPQAASESENSSPPLTNLPTEDAKINETQFSISNPLTWQGGIFLIWIVGVLVLSAVLIQRVFFVKGLIAQSEPVKNRLLETLQDCSKQLGIKRNIQMKLSYNASSPAVCGLFNPVILIPRGLLEKISHEKFSAILIHELSHIKRADLWVNCMQTILQIFYFYNPLVWFVNAIVRRIREQAVDEMVLVALGAEAKSYSNTLIDVAEMAFSRQTLSLRLVGVVESKKALSQRIKHILSRPIPKSAKLGIFGLFVIVIVAAILLPMAKNDEFGVLFGRDILIKFISLDKPNGNVQSTYNNKTYTKNYSVSFRKGEKLAIVTELYQVGKPMRNLGYKVFSGSEKPQKLSIVLKTNFRNEEKTSIQHDLKVTLGNQSFLLDNVMVNTTEVFSNTGLGFFKSSEIRKKSSNQMYVEFENLLRLRVCPNGGKPRAPRIWMPTYNDVTWVDSDAYFISVNMLALSQLDNLHIDVPWYAERMQLPDGAYISGESTKGQRQAVADDYLRNLKEKLSSSQMPLPKLVAHQYYKRDEPIAIKAEQVNSGQWKPTLDDLDKSGNLCFYLIDGQEYDSRLGFGPFNTGGMNLNIPGDLYINLILPAGKHTVAFGWRDVDVINPEEPKKTVHFNRLTTEPVEFEVVREIPDDYYSEVYEDGWEDILASNIGTIFTDDIRKMDVAGTLFTLCVKPLPFEIAFDIYAQAEGSEDREYVTQIARKANMPGNYIVACDHKIKSLDWDNAGQKRYRLILIPSEKVAIANPPIHNYYNREYITDWATFEKSEDFEQNYQTNLKRKEVNKIPRYGGTIKNDKPVDLDRLGRRWNGDSNESQPPEGFELGWSSEKGGILKINPNSNVKMFWFPEANASLIDPDAKTKARLVELPESTTSEINPPKGERTLIAVRSSENKVYFVQVSKVNEQWANLSWWQHVEPQSKDFKATLPNGGTIELVGVRKKSQSDQPWYSPDGRQMLDSTDDIFSSINASSLGIVNSEGTKTYQFFIHCDLPSNKIDKVVKNRWTFQPVQGIPGSFLTSFSMGQHYFAASSAFPETLEKLNLIFEVSNGQWKTIADSDGKSEKEISIIHRGQKQNVTLGKIEEKDGSTFIEVKHKVKEMATGIVVIDKNDKVWHPIENKNEPDGDFIRTVCKFDGITKDGIDHYEFQIQPIDIVTFKDVSLKDGFHTDPKITTAAITDKMPINTIVEAAFTGPELGQYAASLPGGMTVELVGLCEEPVEGSKWWRPDGSEIPEPTFETSTRTSPMGDIPTRYTFLVKAQGGENISMKAKIYEGFGNLTKIAQDGTALCFIKYPDNSKPHHEDAFEKGPIEIGVVQGQWIKGRGGIGEPLHIPRSYLIGSNDEIVIQPPRADIPSRIWLLIFGQVLLRMIMNSNLSAN